MPAAFHYIAAANAPGVADTGSDEQRARLFEQFNDYWLNAASEGVPYDTIGTLTVMAAVYGVLVKYGKTTTAEYLEILAERIRDGVFSVEPASMRPAANA